MNPYSSLKIVILKLSSLCNINIIRPLELTGLYTESMAFQNHHVWNKKSTVLHPFLAAQGLRGLSDLATYRRSMRRNRTSCSSLWANPMFANPLGYWEPHLCRGRWSEWITAVVQPLCCKCRLFSPLHGKACRILRSSTTEK